MKSFALLAVALAASSAAFADAHLLNVSYDPTRELYQQLNPLFAADWQKRTGSAVMIDVSNGGSGKQARAILDGLEADVATLGIASDIDALAEQGKLLPRDWQKRLPQDSAPYTSTIVFVVRKGNPKAIHDWPDLLQSGIQVVTPNPKTSAGGRWAFLAAYLQALHASGGDANKARDYVARLYRAVPVLDSGARGSTTTFARGIGDVLLAWENEAHLILKEFGAERFEIVVPKVSVLAQPPVAVVDKYAQKHGNEKLAEAYLRWLYSPEAQEVIAANFYRPTDPAVAARHASEFPPVERLNVSALGGIAKVQKDFFGDGGLFDQIYANK
ncbi:MAG: sulfate ABC transporter substrate-binding protein [Nevskia sp.]|nr:sulfate ABC transporter substrate-binding protein [Nevskia sp.]